MKYLLLNSLLILALSVTIISCSKKDDCIEVQYNTSFKVESGESYCFPDDMSITIESLDNEFCPCDVGCVWEGQMEVEMMITIDGEDYEYTYYSGGVVADSFALPITLDFTSADIEFSEACTESVPSPDILSTQMTISK